jgi:hypothetical protein
MGWTWGTATGRGRWTRGGIAAAALVVVGLLVGAGYAAGYVARNRQNPVQQEHSQAQGNRTAPGRPSPEAPIPGAPRAPGSPDAPGTPGPGTLGEPGAAEGRKDGGTATTSSSSSTTTTRTTNLPTTTKPPAEHKWFLPPAGPVAPSGNEDVAYRSLNGRRCGSVLDSANGGLFALERHGWLLVGNAHACLGNVQSAEQAADRAGQYAWPIGEDPETVRQICALDKALLDYLNRPARPCGAEATPTEDSSTTNTATESAP